MLFRSLRFHLEVSDRRGRLQVGCFGCAWLSNHCEFRRCCLVGVLERLILRILSAEPLIIVVDLFGAAADQKNTEQVKTETDKQTYGSEVFDLLDSRHHLVNPDKYPGPRQHQQNAPYDL